MNQPRKLRLGAVSYLNTKPLVYGLAELAPEVELSFDLPSRLADDLAAGRLDVALIPSVEYFQDPSYSIVSDACIGCRGPVLSVKLLSRVPPEKIRTLALDEGSRTSAALVRILLEQRFGLRPQLVPLPIGAKAEECPADAILLIGDRAIHSPAGSYAAVWDLGDEWCRWSELPFVFAMWTARAGVDLGEIELALSRARDEGVAHLEEIAAAESAAVGLTRPECLSYLRDNLYFHLGPRETRGLELFRRHAAELGLAPAALETRAGWLEAEPQRCPSDEATGCDSPGWLAAEPQRCPSDEASLRDSSGWLAAEPQRCPSGNTTDSLGRRPGSATSHPAVDPAENALP